MPRSQQSPQRWDHLDLWWAGLRIGLRTLPREPLLGLKRLVLPLSYWRTAEFLYACRHIPCTPAARVLDIGSPKDLAAILARDTECEIVATDILPTAVDLSRRYAMAQGLDGSGPGKVRSEIQDARALQYPDASFDAVYSVSVIEHIPGNGDSEAVREIVRVLKPGGVAVFTVPFHREYSETFVQREVYERQWSGNDPIFYERHYDMKSLKQRLQAVSGTEVVDTELWGEPSVHAEQLLAKLGALRNLLAPIEGLLSRLFLRRLRDQDDGNAMAAFFTLRKVG